MPEVAPFDAVVLTAAAPRAPDALLEQLDVGGRMVLPIARNDEQHLFVIERTARGIVERRMDPVVFVPLQSGVG
jgi:protein-L-isoaspartate(D-aspartate) O-methyltransferase